jgi:hypothetical protein
MVKGEKPVLGFTELFIIFEIRKGKIPNLNLFWSPAVFSRVVLLHLLTTRSFPFQLDAMPMTQSHEHLAMP